MKKNTLWARCGVILALLATAASCRGRVESAAVAAENAANAALPVYHCTYQYFDLSGSTEAVFSRTYDVDLSAKNFVSTFVPMSPQENWQVLVQVNRDSETDNGRPGSGGPVRIPGLKDNEIRFAISHTTESTGAEVRLDQSTRSVNLRYNFPKNTPFDKSSWLEVACKSK